MIKQVILYRRDLNMRKGKIAAQVAHASMGVFFNRKLQFKSMHGTDFPVKAVLTENPEAAGSEDPDTLISVPKGAYLMVPLSEDMVPWVNGSFAKIVLSVENEADLVLAHAAAQNAGLPTSIITDAGKTEFHGVPTRTTVAIGPGKAEDIDKITGPEGLVKTKLA